MIKLSTASVNGKLQVNIADNGCGMSDEVMENIFIPFYTTKKNGSGIGLALIKQILLLHYAKIRVNSIEGEGTEFILVL